MVTTQAKHPGDEDGAVKLQPGFHEMDKAEQVLSIRQRQISGELVSCTRCKPALANAVMLQVSLCGVAERICFVAFPRSRSGKGEPSRGQ